MGLLRHFREFRERLAGRLAAVAAEARSLESELAGMRFTGRSDRGLVSVEADSFGQVVAIRIEERLTRVRASDLAAQVVQAVNRAVRDARETTDTAVRRQLGQYIDPSVLGERDDLT